MLGLYWFQAWCAVLVGQQPSGFSRQSQNFLTSITDHAKSAEFTSGLRVMLTAWSVLANGSTAAGPPFIVPFSASMNRHASNINQIYAFFGIVDRQIPTPDWDGCRFADNHGT